MPFTPDFICPSSESDGDLWFIYHRDNLLVTRGNEGYHVPRRRDLADFKPTLIRKQFIGYLDDTPCYAAEISTDRDVPEDFGLKGLREAFLRRTG